MPKNTKAPYILSVVSALCLAAAFYPLDLGLLAWFSLAPFLLALRRSSGPQAAGVSMVFGYVHGAAIFQWLPSVEGIGYPLFFFLLCPLFALYYLAFGTAYRAAAVRAGALTPFLAGSFWVAAEYARAGMGFLSLPWNLLGHTQHGFLPVIQIADMTGVYGISFAIVMVNETLSRWLESAWTREKPVSIGRGKPVRPPLRATAGALAVLAFLLVYGFSISGEPAAGETLRVAVVQPGKVVQDSMSEEDRHVLLGETVGLTLEALKHRPDLVVWPASSLTGSLASRAVKVPMRELMRQANSPILVGGSGAAKMSMVRGEGRLYANTEFLLSRAGPTRRYHKVRLVPFNEYLPLGGKARWPKWITTLEANFTPGPALTLFKIDRAVFGAPICWESLFPGLFRRFVLDGANFMVNPNNEAYMGKTAGPWQTMAMTVFRAVENRVPIARASSTGISALIRPDGKVVGRVGDSGRGFLFVPGVIVGNVTLSDRKTFYTRHGDIFASGMAGITVLFAAARLAARIRRRPGKGD